MTCPVQKYALGGTADLQYLRGFAEIGSTLVSHRIWAHSFPRASDWPRPERAFT